MRRTMSRAIASLVVFAAVGLAFGAQDGRRLAQADVARPFLAGQGPKIEPAGDPAPSAEEREALIKQIKERLGNAESRLDSKNPDEETRTLQKQIIDDLDKLLKGQQPPRGNPPPSSPKSPANTKSGEAVPPKASAPEAKPEPKPQPKSLTQPGPADPKKETSTGNDAANPKTPAAKTTPKSDPAKKDQWSPMLPSRPAQETDAYARDRLLRKHEQIIREYYRSIAGARDRDSSRDRNPE